MDANQGVQAQTVSNCYLAFGNNLEIIPVINKIDLPGARTDEVKEQLSNLFDIDPGDVLLTSAKLGTGVEELLDAVVERVPALSTRGVEADTRALLFDSWFDKYMGAINVIQVTQYSANSRRLVEETK